jgi:VWFA-related protein
MIQPLIAGERGAAAVLSFDEEVRVIEQFTSDGSKIRQAFQKIHGHSGTGGRMLDAMTEALAMLDERPGNHRRILILLSEARDRGSKTKLPDAIESVQREGAIVYPLTYSAYKTPWTARPEDNPTSDGSPITGLGDLFRLGKENTAEALAKASGGEKISFNTLGALEKAIARASAEIHSEYLVSFAPAESDNHGFHRLEVTVPSRRDAVVRARTGYWPAQ